MRWAFSTVLGLVAFQTLVSRAGSGRVGQFFTDANHLLERALDPTVPAIPDRAPGKAVGTSQRDKDTDQAEPLSKAVGLRTRLAPATSAGQRAV